VASIDEQLPKMTPSPSSAWGAATPRFTLLFARDLASDLRHSTNHAERP
jgi:hypothetical protein